ncbi:MAG: efflux RND transporter periplasmic adaptor subunit [Candidatus Thiodiazotropha endolucinida]|uniref:Multidrug resistance protein MdtA n=1 Tax=Candidatus Thiodiazotropha endolucinida TaxID=1655433 RepID=A0A7Z1AD76_9GAMM|nr:efflux RND transporter periplasmic adaptor subunit [Candidatus Thiodiazotropha endolucinida]ODJ85660.1 multidrug resistance protein MdtA precursor [Candidatus Thiodiazotropha endolucinida]
MYKLQYRIILFTMLALGGLSGCQQDETETKVENIRPIKTITLTAKTQATEERKFSGLVSPANSSSLSFEVSGKVIEITVDVGDQVVVGQRLAVVDDEPFKLKVQSAEADFKKAKANFKHSASDYERKSELAVKGYVSASDLDSALAQRDAARNQEAMALSQLNIAKRELRKTVLKAPFGGYISKRLVEPHQEIVSGQELLQLDELEEVDVELMLPENIIGYLKQGDVGIASFPSLQDIHVEGRIDEIGTLAEAANTFPVSLRLDQRPDGLYPGITAEVQLLIDHGEQNEGFLLPASAIVAGVGTGSGRHSVFVYEPQSGAVRKQSVFVSGGQRQMARITEGLRTGDTVAVAGVSFLSDGMKVRLLDDKRD